MAPNSTTNNNYPQFNNNNLKISNKSKSYADLLVQQQFQQDRDWQSINTLMNNNDYNQAFQLSLLHNNDGLTTEGSDNNNTFTKLLAQSEPKEILGNLTNNILNDVYRGIANNISSVSATDNNNKEYMRWLVALTRPRPKSIVQNSNNMNNSNNNNNSFSQSKSFTHANSTSVGTSKLASSANRLSSSSSSSSLPCCQELNQDVIIQIIKGLDVSYINNNNSSQTTRINNNNQQEQQYSDIDKTRAFALLLKSILNKQLQTTKST